MTYALLTEGMNQRERKRFDHQLRPPVDPNTKTQPRNDPGDLDMLKRMMGAAG